MNSMMGKINKKQNYVELNQIAPMEFKRAPKNVENILSGNVEQLKNGTGSSLEFKSRFGSVAKFYHFFLGPKSTVPHNLILNLLITF